jgi:hypothetical protein
VTGEEKRQLRGLTRRWVSKANHPMRQGSPEGQAARDAYLRCARDVSEWLAHPDPGLAEDHRIERPPDLRAVDEGWLP